MLYVQAAQNNGSVYLHAYFAPTGLPLEPSDPFYDPKVVFHKTSSARLSVLATCDAVCSRKYMQCNWSDSCCDPHFEFDELAVLARTFA